MTKKWFRYKGLYFGKRFGTENRKIEVLAPTIAMLRAKLAVELDIFNIDKMTHAKMDRVEVFVSNDGSAEVARVLVGNIFDAKAFEKQTERIRR